MSEKAGELWERGQELDGSAEELLAELRADNADRDWDWETIHRRMVSEDEHAEYRRANDD
jgi:hypothetical protein